MIKIRFARKGSKNNIFYRIVAIDSKRKREGASLAVVGTFNPQKDEVKVDKEKLKYFLLRGAILTKAVKDILRKKEISI